MRLPSFQTFVTHQINLSVTRWWLIMCGFSLLLLSIPLPGFADIVLTWNPNSETDLAGYNIYQRKPPSLDYGSPIFSGIPSMSTIPFYAVPNLSIGETYSFSMTAFDQSGNESLLTEEVSTTVASDANITTSLVTAIVGAGHITSSPAGLFCLGGTCRKTFPTGTTVTLTATPASGFVFSGWNGACSGTGNCSVSLTSVRAVMATFIEQPIDTQTFVGSVSGDGTLTSTPAGLNCSSNSICTADFPVGTSVTLVATPASGSVFSAWGGACLGLTTCTLTIEAFKTEAVSAHFISSGNTQPLAVTVAGTGSGTVTSSPAGLSCSSGTCTTNMETGTLVGLTATPGSGASFSGWSGACSGTGSCTVTMNTAQNVTATFTASAPTDTQALVVVVTGSGTVTSSPAGLSCSSGTCTADFATGTVVSLTATPSSGASFSGWGSACSGTGTCTVTMTTAQGVSATFTASGPSGWAVNFQPSSAGVPSGYQADDGAVYSSSRGYGWSTNLQGQTRERNAQSDQRLDTAVFTGAVATWQLDVPNGSYVVSLASGDASWAQGPHRVVLEGQVVVNGVSTAANEYVTITDWPVTVNDGQLTIQLGGTSGTSFLNYVTVTAAGGASTHALGVTVAGTGSGTVTSSPAGLSCSSGTCTADFATGTVVSLTATPGSGASFSGWSGACSGTGTCTVTMTAAQNVTATFTASAPSTHQLAVTVAGTGSGTVTSSPAGLSCSSGTCTVQASAGTVVSLTATPGSEASFSGWSGACSGTGTCTVTMTAAQNVTATFTAGVPSGTTALVVVVTGSGTVTSSPAGLSCSSGTCTADFPIGTVVGLTATPGSGANFSGWGGVCSGTGTCTVTMTTAQGVSATFTASGPSGWAVNFQPSSAGVPSGYQADDGAVYSSSRGYGWSTNLQGQTRERNAQSDQRLDTAVFTGAVATWQLDVPNGSYVVSLASGDASWAQGPHRVVLEGQVVVNGVSTAANEYVTITDWPVTVNDGQLTIQLGGTSGTSFLNYVTVTAAGGASTHALGVTVAGTGSGTVTSSPAGLSCSSGTCTADFATGTVVSLTATPGSGASFSGWSGACSGTGSCTVTMNTAQNVTATFTASAPSTHQLAVTVAGTGSGTVTSSPAGLSCSSGTCTVQASAGTVVSLTATPGSEASFSGWSGACSGTGSCTVTMTAAQGVSATFTASGPSGWAVNFQPSSAGVPSGYQADDGAVYSSSRGYGWSTNLQGQTRERNAQSDQRLDTAVFTGAVATWQLDVPNGSYVVSLASGDASWAQGPHRVVLEGQVVVNGVSTAANEYVTITDWPVTVNDGQLTIQLGGTSGTSFLNYVTVTAAGGASTHALGVTVAGTGSGTVTSSPAGLSCSSGTCTTNMETGTLVGLTATPGSGASFSGWSGACSGTGSCTVTMNTAQNVTATFTASAPTDTQALVVVVTGSGTVTSSPAGLSCSSGTCTADFATGTVVSLTATPGSGASFSGWGSACSGTGTCTVTMTTAQGVSATFTASGPSGWAVNFQPSSAGVPSGYQADDGAVYSSSRGYGWSTNLQGQTRERNAQSDQRLDTAVFTGAVATWQLDVPNGSYVVSLASGDASWAQGPHRVVLEGQVVVNGVSTAANEYVTITDWPVTVNDGQLTIQLGGTSGTSFLNYVTVTQK